MMKVTTFRSKFYFRYLVVFLTIGSILYLLLYSSEKVNVPFHSSEETVNKNYTILIWEHGKRMLRRFFYSYGKTELDPFLNCSVRNCEVTIHHEDLSRSDAVMFHLHQTKGPHTLPKLRLPNQIWIFFTDESPLHTFLLTRKYSMKDYNGYFNWSMTYREDSDVPAPYGRTIRLTDEERRNLPPLPNFFKQNHRLVSILGSNCGGQNRRWHYVRELKKYLQVDVYGGCGNLKCPGHFTKDCEPMKNYKFYLAFENSDCREYITEKLWWNAYHKNAVPVVMGAPKEDYVKLCPPNSFLHVDDFASPLELSKTLLYLSSNETAYNKLFEWKKEYRVSNEHGYLGSPSLHVCRMCETLNNPKKIPKVYNKLEDFWNPTKDCRPPNWQI
ncbi:glycoprotein 3-alpha-L-fucosyltransferase A-like [Centruroides sculpturatus]|uniref:glycoprotein 3-alpha-L-fucosyltransferase A-like n=1 Tax=Centruroides sculpturatus TaxID=218467 RepID=UPI000C6E25E6|nr:glycoprotein 3-alpha-L-fucosyltransferase A-like [Centruroides sculpturatus]XP_023238970.1 glycoprotein 3-alpha-L-fucosyltransferase A-like [Centruroides sculpturatus]XP_023241122.1 glycoprotein 3-alpha-L-fucosyltransferase A-like [Centruroides sculpturatus]XP_023241123.1 glycoprotein 3-alpha-L-fucosyltransferase A-like [Centruroides sculpturatus]